MYRILVGLILICTTLALPVIKKEETTTTTTSPADIEQALEYERYLKEVVEALESDPEFRKKLDKAPEADIRSGKIAQELDYVNHHVRSKLDEIKRREVERLRQLANREYELENDIERDHLKLPPQHLDHANEHTFEIEDLRKLIKKTSEDIAEADRKRRDEFKEYEMQKEFERETKMKEMDGEHRKQYENELKEQDQKHKKHEKLHHPGNKAQLEEVWEKQDHMDKQDFDARSFFMMHDVDSNGFWDETEVKALFVKELDKVYQSGLPEDDMRERAEEMERMREHVFKETDRNHDGLISYEEFLEQTKRDEFNKDPEWETVDEQPQYTHEEYLEFERRRQEEIQRLIAQGQLPPHPNMPQGYYPNGQPQINPNGQQVQLNQNQIYEHVPNNIQPQQLHQQPYQHQPQQVHNQPQQQVYNQQHQQQQVYNQQQQQPVYNQAQQIHQQHQPAPQPQPQPQTHQFVQQQQPQPQQAYNQQQPTVNQQALPQPIVNQQPLPQPVNQQALPQHNNIQHPSVAAQQQKHIPN